jgi:hypothetical protein
MAIAAKHTGGYGGRGRKPTKANAMAIANETCGECRGDCRQTHGGIHDDCRRTHEGNAAATADKPTGGCHGDCRRNSRGESTTTADEPTGEATAIEPWPGLIRGACARRGAGTTICFVGLEPDRGARAGIRRGES